MLTLQESPLVGPVWVVHRWDEARHLPPWWPVFSRYELDTVMPRLYRSPPATDVLKAIAEAKAVFGRGTVVVSVKRRLRAFSRRADGRMIGQGPRGYLHEPPEPGELDFPEE